MKKIVIVIFMLASFSFVYGQEKTITGTVSDSLGTLPGVSVIIKGTTNGVETGLDGKYSIKTNLGDVLVFRYLGYTTVEKTVGKSNTINVILKEEEAVLDEVVMTAYGEKSKSTSAVVSYSVSKLEGSVKGISNRPRSGLLTAGEINDMEKWSQWEKLLKEKGFEKVKGNWLFALGDKLEVKVTDKTGRPITGAKVYLVDQENKITIGRTDYKGKVLFFKSSSNFFTVQVLYEGKIKGLKITKAYSKLNFEFENKRAFSGLDVMFTIDATGSMSDEINYLKSELENIISRIDKSVDEKRVGLTFYRDISDEYVTREFDFSSNIEEVKKNLLLQRAGGGGDYEEAVEIALKKSLSMSWNEKSKTKLMFLLLDAPPHLNEDNVETIKNQISKAKEMGVKIIPIVASGANKEVEYLMRYFSVYTNGTYVFLTDDSGIGNKHLKPTAKEYKVEKLNDLIVRLINKYVGVS